MIDVNESYLQATGRERFEIIGHELFEVFPDDPNDHTVSGVSDLRASLTRVLRAQKPDVMGIQKYNITDKSGNFIEKYWCPVNAPVMDANKATIAIIHHVLDVTDIVSQNEVLLQECTERSKEVETRLTTEILARSEQIKETNRALKATRSELEQSNITNKTLLTELRHRVKNTLAQIQALVRIEESSTKNPEVMTALAALEGRVNAFSELYLQLHDRDEVKSVELDSYLSNIAWTLFQSVLAKEDEGKISLSLHMDNIVVSAKQASSYGLILNELLTNTLKYAFREKRYGDVEVSLSGKDDHIALEVTDNGDSLPLDFNPARSKGLGLMLVETLSRQLGGDFRWSQDGSTKFSLITPKNLS